MDLIKIRKHVFSDSYVVMSSLSLQVFIAWNMAIYNSYQIYKLRWDSFRTTFVIKDL